MLSGKREATLAALGVVAGFIGRTVSSATSAAVPRTDRGAWGAKSVPARGCRSAALRCRTSRGIAEIGREGRHARLRRCRRWRSALKVGRSMRSAALGGRLRGCTCGRPAIPFMSCTATDSAKSFEFARLVRPGRRRTCRISRWSPSASAAAALCGDRVGAIGAQGTPKQVDLPRSGVREGLLYER